MPFVSIRITKDGATREQKSLLIREVTNTLERVLSKDPTLTHVTIEEIDPDNWGYAGRTAAELRRPKSR
jgi:4-oxalocrotonate tautomerase